MTHDLAAAEEAFDVCRSKADDAFDLESGKGAAEVVALGEDRPPAQPGQERFEAELLEQLVIVTDGPTPLVIVIVDEPSCAPCPPAAFDTVRANATARSSTEQRGEVGMDAGWDDLDDV